MDFNTSLIVGQDSVARISSLELARILEYNHASILKIIDEKMHRLARHAEVSYSYEKSGNGIPRREAFLTKEQFGSFMMYVRGSDFVLDFRDRVYDLFLEYEQLRAQPVLDIPVLQAEYTIDSRVLAASLGIESYSCTCTIRKHRAKMLTLASLYELLDNKSRELYYVLSRSQEQYYLSICRNTQQKYLKALLASTQEERFLN
jgi:hypothetical protein